MTPTTQNDWETILAAVLDEPTCRLESAFSTTNRPYDAAVRTPFGTFGLMIRGAHTRSTVHAVRRRIDEAAPFCPEVAAWVLCVPTMPPAAAEHARTLDVAWIDAAGNADIRLAALRVRVIGRKAEKTATAVRPLVTAPAERRVAIALLAGELPARPSRLVRDTDVNPVQVNRLLVGLSENGIVVRGHRGAVVGIDRARLLGELRVGCEKGTWRWMRGSLSGECGADLARTLSERIERTDVGTHYALTGVAAAARLVPGSARDIATATVYLDRGHVLATFNNEIGFVQSVDGPIAIRVTDEPAVRVGTCRIDGVQCVAPAQAYLDLSDEDMLAYAGTANLLSLASAGSPSTLPVQGGRDAK